MALGGELGLEERPSSRRRAREGIQQRAFQHQASIIATCKRAWSSSLSKQQRPPPHHLTAHPGRTPRNSTAFSVLVTHTLCYTGPNSPLLLAAQTAQPASTLQLFPTSLTLPPLHSLISPSPSPPTPFLLFSSSPFLSPSASATLSYCSVYRSLGVQFNNGIAPPSS